MSKYQPSEFAEHFYRRYDPPLTWVDLLAIMVDMELFDGTIKG